MQVIALPGRNPKTRSWFRAVLTEAALPVDGIVEYRHWHTEVEADVDVEAKRLHQQQPTLVLAKSLGTVIAAKAYCHHQFRPRAAILIGTPFGARDSDDLTCLQQFANGVETLFIQQTEDPGGAASALAAALQLLQGEVVTVLGNDHLYSDVAAISAIIRRRIDGCGEWGL